MSAVDQGTTHWADCWKVHGRCAALRVERLAACVRIQRQALVAIAELDRSSTEARIAQTALKEAHW